MLQHRLLDGLFLNTPLQWHEVQLIETLPLNRKKFGVQLNYLQNIFLGETVVD